MNDGPLLLFGDATSVHLRRWAQEMQSRGWRAGVVQMGMDCTIVLLALTVVDPVRVAYSVLAAVVMNLFIAVNHRPGRYAVL